MTMTTPNESKNPRNPHGLGNNLWQDVACFLPESPLVFDIGGNIGTVIRRIKQLRPKAVIHSFEPNPDTQERLTAVAAQHSGVHVHCTAIGSAPGVAPFHIQKAHMSSSFLSHRSMTPQRTQSVTLSTVDIMRADLNLDRIHLLKTDTQGFEKEVLKGAHQTLAKHLIDIVLLELMFEPIYKNYGRFEDVYSLLRDNGYRLVSLYNADYAQGHYATWCDGLFVRESFGKIPKAATLPIEHSPS